VYTPRNQKPKWIVSTSLKSMELQLVHMNLFIRTAKTSLVNRNHIRSINLEAKQVRVYGVDLPLKIHIWRPCLIFIAQNAYFLNLAKGMERNIEQRNIFRIISWVKKTIESFWFSLLVVVALISYQQWLLGEELFAPDSRQLLNHAIYYGLIYITFHLNIRYFFPRIFSDLRGWWWKMPIFIGSESFLLFTLAVTISVIAGKMEVRFAFALLDLTNLYHKKAVLGPWFLYTVLNLGYYFCWQAFHLLANLWIEKRVTDDRLIMRDRFSIFGTICWIWERDLYLLNLKWRLIL
jgi:hypothetical protein